MNQPEPQVNPTRNDPSFLMRCRIRSLYLYPHSTMIYCKIRMMKARQVSDTALDGKFRIFRSVRDRGEKHSRSLRGFCGLVRIFFGGLLGVSKR